MKSERRCDTGARAETGRIALLAATPIKTTANTSVVAMPTSNLRQHAGRGNNADSTESNSIDLYLSLS